jgi:hypothetical protein
VLGDVNFAQENIIKVENSLMQLDNPTGPCRDDKGESGRGRKEWKIREG